MEIYIYHNYRLTLHLTIEGYKERELTNLEAAVYSEIPGGSAGEA